MTIYLNIIYFSPINTLLPVCFHWNVRWVPPMCKAQNTQHAQSCTCECDFLAYIQASIWNPAGAWDEMRSICSFFFLITKSIHPFIVADQASLPSFCLDLDLSVLAHGTPNPNRPTPRSFPAGCSGQPSCLKEPSAMALLVCFQVRLVFC